MKYYILAYDEGSIPNILIVCRMVTYYFTVYENHKCLDITISNSYISIELNTPRLLGQVRAVYCCYGQLEC